MKSKIILIGNGGASYAALEEMLERIPDAQFTIITEESIPTYYRPMLSEYISEPSLPNRFFLHDDAWYKERSISVRYNSKVTEIFTNEKYIQLASGEKLNYDRLILTTGSNNFIPPLPGIHFPNVLNLRTKADADQIKTLIPTLKKVVIIGGGLLGLELGWQLKRSRATIDITVLEMMDRLLPRQLDVESSIIFEKKVLDAGIQVIKAVQTQEIVGGEVATGVLLSNGTVIEADLVIISIGIRANIALAKEAGLATNRGVIVNDFMQTSDPFIYAAGDCAEYNGINYAIWPEAVEQGKIAGLNAAGIVSVYEPIVPFNIYHGMNMRLFSIGDVGSNPENQYEITHRGDQENFEKYYYVDDKIVGGILMGNISKSGKLKKAVAAQLSKQAFEAML